MRKQTLLKGRPCAPQHDQQKLNQQHLWTVLSHNAMPWLFPSLNFILLPSVSIFILFIFFFSSLP